MKRHRIEEFAGVNPHKIPHMKRGQLLFVVILFILFALVVKAGSDVNTHNQTDFSKYPFVENKGQLADEQGQALTDCLFKVSLPGMDVYIRANGVSYVLISGNQEDNEREAAEKEEEKEEEKELQLNRMDMELKGAAVHASQIITEESSEYSFNYFAPHCPNGIYGVKSYKKITIKNVYPGIDWVWYTDANQGLKYDFMVQPGINPALISMQYKWAKLSLKEEATVLELKSKSVKMKEGKLICFSNEKIIPAKYMKKGNEISLSINEYDNTLPLRIDPQLKWLTFYGSNNLDGNTDCDIDQNGNIYIVSYNNSINLPNINPGSAYQQSHPGGTNEYMHLAKFGPAGNLIWATFYAGNTGGNMRAYDVCTDNQNNVFVMGRAGNAVNIPVFDPGGGAYFQAAKAGGDDSFITKFNASGTRLWATYLGGAGSSDDASGINADNAGNLYVVGTTSSTSFPVKNVAGAYNQATLAGSSDGFICKFSPSCAMLWSTYLGGSGTDQIIHVDCDQNNNVLIVGGTTSTNLPTVNPGSGAYFQSANAGNGDLMIGKFSAAGACQWLTYYGGSGGEMGYLASQFGLSGFSSNAGIAIDKNNNIFIASQTSSSNFPLQDAGNGAFYQNTFNGTSICLLKFDGSGVRKWASYFGNFTAQTAGYDPANYWNSDNITTDDCGNLFLGASRASGGSIPVYNAMNCFYSMNTGGAFVAQFSNDGIQQWTSFVSGNATAPTGFWRTWASGIFFDNNRKRLYVTGELNYTTITNTVDAGNGAYYDATFDSSDDTYIERFDYNLKTEIKSYANACGCVGVGVANVLCGMPPFKYTWSNGVTHTTSAAKDSVTDLCPGTYSVVVKDAMCLDTTLIFTIQSSGGLTVDIAAQTDIKCKGQSNGSATVTVSGGVSPYTYSWAPAGGTAASANNLAAGTYTVTATDASGCTSIKTVTINESPEMNLAFTSTPSTCNGNTGTATVTVSLGTAPYTYSWAPSGGSTLTANNLAAGSYTLTVTDANNCVKTGTVNITSSGGGPQISVSSTAPSCNNSTDGTATATASGGIAPYTYSWAPTGGNSATATNLPAGDYTITVSDASACVSTQTITLSKPAALALMVTTTDAGCGLSDGTATATVSGGTSPYTYNWQPGSQTTANATGLAAGVYTLTVTDSKNCKESKTTTVNNSNGPLIVLENKTDVKCKGEKTGAVSVSVSGGSAPYTYNWQPIGATTATANNLAAGDYTLTVTDAGNCVQTFTISINEASALELTISSVTATCGTANGSALVSASGGTIPYTYQWLPSGGTTAAAGNLSAGNYTVNVTDAQLCSKTETVTVAGVPAPKADLEADVYSGCAPLCVKFNDKSSAVVGDVVTSWTWNFGDNTQATSQNPQHCFTSSGQYQVSLSITSSKGCVSTANMTTKITVFDQPKAAFFTDPSEINLSEAMVNFQNTSQGAATYLWNFGDEKSTTSTAFQPKFTYINSTCYPVKLLAVSVNGCKDSVVKEICIKPEVSLYRACS